jgi:predicted DNA-binding transcriptional regulator YafY
MCATLSDMLKTAPRLLQLLALLQRRRSWSGRALADELGVTTRTIRNDMDRLRDLGYPVSSSPGVEGGYRLGAGADLPPLLLDDGEAVAMAIGLAGAATGGVAGLEESCLRALAKLEQVMPDRVRKRLRTVQQAVVTLPRFSPTVDAADLSSIAAACRDNLRLRFDYTDHRGSARLRSTEPHRVVQDGRRFYLVAWDLDRADWRTFRLDRMKLRLPAGPHFPPRPPPGGDLLAHVARSLGQATWLYRVAVKIHAPARELQQRLPRAIDLEPIDDHTCLARVGADNPAMLALYLGMMGADFEVIDAPELRSYLQQLGRRYLRAAHAA